MAELTPQERLQPSLIDRLADDYPNKQREALDRHAITLEQLRTYIIRDLSWLLNTGNLAQAQDLSDYPHVEKSVLNYGVLDLAGRAASNLDFVAIEREIQHAIKFFEPRISENNLRVTARSSADEMNGNALVFEISAEHWAQPVPLELLLRSEVDLETGTVAVTERH